MGLFAMRGHDGRSMGSGKEIEEWASGRGEGFQPQREAMQSPAVTPAQAKFPARRGVKHAGHNENVDDEDEARKVRQDYVTLHLVNS